MEIKNGNPRPTHRMRSDWADVLIDPERVMHKKMTGSPWHETVRVYDSARDSMDTTAAFCNRIRAATAVQKAQKSQTAGFEVLGDENKAMMPESVVEQSSRDP